MNRPKVPDMRKRQQCKQCNQPGRPMLRTYGIPTDYSKAKALELEGRFKIMGCSIVGNPAQYECRHCEAGLPQYGVLFANEPYDPWLPKMAGGDS